MTAADAREELEALLWRQHATPRPLTGAAMGEMVDAVLAAADRYAVATSDLDRAMRQHHGVRVSAALADVVTSWRAP